jgi:hypothetical protein
VAGRDDVSCLCRSGRRGGPGGMGKLAH